MVKELPNFTIPDVAEEDLHITKSSDASAPLTVLAVVVSSRSVKEVTIRGSESKVRELEEHAKRSMAEIEGSSEELASTLFKLGWRSADDVARAKTEELGGVPGVGGEVGAGRLKEAAGRQVEREKVRKAEAAQRAVEEAAVAAAAAAEAALAAAAAAAAGPSDAPAGDGKEDPG